MAALLIGTAVAYLWDLGSSGWANSFYSAAVQAGSQSWKAFLFGSSDAANSITVDKPPASLWLMALSVRIFGLSSWAILVPQALLGVGSVAMLCATVRRYFGSVAGLLAGLVLAVTPVATLMFRFNNPDALLVFLMIAAVWALMRGVEDGRTRWLVVTGIFVGLGFLTKQLQVMLVVPPLALTYLVAGPPRLGKRIWQLFAAAAAMLVSAGWWIAIVELWPASSRPWIGGSQNNSILELTFGYNGLGRLSGDETGSVVPGGMDRAGSAATYAAGGFAGGMPDGGPGSGGGMWGFTGITRMFEAAQGGQIAWLIPAALVLLVLGIVLRGRMTRTDPTRAALIVWGAWLLVTGLTFSFMAGIFHAYYTVALAPAVAALVGGGSVLAWRHRDLLRVRMVGAATLLLTGATAWILLSRSPDFVPWLRWVVVVAAVVAAGLFVVPTLSRRVAAVAIGAALLAGLGGPVAYAAQTISTPRTGLSSPPARTSSSVVAVWAACPAAATGASGAGCAGRRRAGRNRRHGRDWTGRYDRTRRHHRARPTATGAGGRNGRRHGRTRRLAQRQQAERGTDRDARAGRRPVHLDRGDHRCEQCVGLPARHRAPGDADRRLQRHRPVADAGAVPALRRRGQDPLVHRWRRHGRLRPRGHVERDHRVGGAELHRDRGRRDHALRPHVARVLIPAAP